MGISSIIEYKKKYKVLEIWFCDLFLFIDNNIQCIKLVPKKEDVLSNRILLLYNKKNKPVIKGINFFLLALKYNFIKDKNEYIELLSRTLIIANKKKINNEITKEKKIIQTTVILNKIIKIINIYNNTIKKYKDLKDNTYDTDSQKIIENLNMNLESIISQKKILEEYINSLDQQQVHN